MTTTDKLLGAFLFLFALPAAIQADVHWLPISLLVVACVVFVGFVLQLTKERCGRCGHYYMLTLYETHIKKTTTKRCTTCAPASESNDTTAALSK